MEGLSWVMYANMVVWLGIGAYLCVLGRKLARLEARARRAEYARQRDAARQDGQNV